jgi:gliding-associated putative ABC transporter substrate-binding component GldG
MAKEKPIHKNDWWMWLVAGLIIINILAAQFHYRIDLTAEKRYSLSGPTKTLLSKLDQPVRIEVFLKGDFPAGFKKLANSVNEFLQEAKEYGKGNLKISFVDPFKMAEDSAQAFIDRNRDLIAKDSSANENEVSNLYTQYFIDSIANRYDINPYTLQAPAKVGDEQIEKRVLPGAIIYYKDSSIGVDLLQGAKTFGTEPEQLAALYNNVEASMEYKFASAIQKITANDKPNIAYSMGHGEAWGFNVDDAVRTLFKNYNFDTINLKQLPYIPEQINALVLLKPTLPFNDAEKLKIDQYIMHGGKVFWMIDNMYAEFDSLRNSDGFIAFDRGLNLEDILFNYGIRINQTLLQDMQCDKLPQTSGEGQQQRLVDWPFFPILNGNDHPISKNLDGVRALFPTTLDTVEAKGIKKTVLLQSSNNARLLNAPARIDFEFLQIAPDQNLFRQKNIPVAFLLEGRFKSLYTGRVSRSIADTLNSIGMPFKAVAQAEGKMIIVSDGDIAVNQYSPSTGPLPMGMNLFTRYTFANKNFFTNALEYLVNPTDILQARSKEFTLRLLDPKRVNEKKITWQLINIVLPILIIILLGIIYQQLRKRKYTA